ncbi:MAG: DUF971 domain-containing protein [Thermodesulfobacteriota bacterium]
MKPNEITEFSQSALLITWEDGHESVYTYEELREVCPCAACNTDGKREEKPKSGFRRIPLRVSRANVTSKRIEDVGSYAIRFYWSDGHDTGIYTFDFLRGMCSCNDCMPEAG